MRDQRKNLGDSFFRDPVALLNRKRVVCWFELNVWPYSVITKVNHRLQIHSVRIDPYVGRKPAEKRPDM
jgi:hypothetical protein